MDELRRIIERMERLEKWRSEQETRESATLAAALAAMDARLLALEGDLVDYSTASTIVGWSSFTEREIYYKRAGSLVYVSYSIAGPSNSTSIKFLLPLAKASLPTVVHMLCQAQDNGGTAVAGLARLSNVEPQTLVLYRTPNGDGWTASGTKLVRGQFWYPAA
ncbi:MAG TPA: hypothetical protein PKD55_05795 [Bellilinea sp.]|nr:hypothetical protein [Bellilinea sp.]